MRINPLNDIAIQVENLGKRYRIGRAQKRHDTLRDQISDWASRIARLKSATPKQSTDDTFWALQDVSFEIKRGEVVGVIGRNGAGKSTLLKILSRITKPTTGYADLHGRVGSLLEVGTGFHAELTGRENIYLSGAILGMLRAEIDRKFDEIVAFSEIEKFVDTPVKHYSSGMYVRLAFAVAAHLEPEILLVDEVLAVGDAAFQKKCLGKMGDVAKEGRTVMFVSHNMQAVQALCPSSILLEKGILLNIGPSDDILAQYLKNVSDIESRSGFVSFADHQISGRVINLVSVRSMDLNGETITSIPCGGEFILDVAFQMQRRIQPFFDFQIRDEYGTKTALVSSYFGHNDSVTLDSCSVARVRISQLNLIPGRYSIDMIVHLHGGEKILAEENAIYFDLVPSDFFRTGKLPPRAFGTILLPCEWSFHAFTKD